MFADCEAPSYAVGVETSDKIARLSHGDLDLALHGDLESAMQRWLNALSPHTMRSYMTGLRQFAEYCYAHNLIQEPTIENAGDFLMALPAGQAKMLSQAWLESLAAVDAKTGRPRYTKATIEVRASALRWAINTAHEQGRIPWTLKLKIPKSAKDPKTGRMVRKKGRNMKGPPLEDIIQMFEVARHNENDAGAGELILSLIFIGSIVVLLAMLCVKVNDVFDAVDGSDTSAKVTTLMDMAVEGANNARLATQNVLDVTSFARQTASVAGPQLESVANSTKDLVTDLRSWSFHPSLQIAPGG